LPPVSAVELGNRVYAKFDDPVLHAVAVVFTAANCTLVFRNNSSLRRFFLQAIVAM
jgi:hypothetical protein